MSDGEDELFGERREEWIEDIQRKNSTFIAEGVVRLELSEEGAIVRPDLVRDRTVGKEVEYGFVWVVTAMAPS